MPPTFIFHFIALYLPHHLVTSSKAFSQPISRFNNVTLQLHGTYRRKDRIYKEDIFYGKGKPLSEATAEELKEDMEERQSENPLAYRENELVYKLSDAELAEVRASRKNNKKIN